MELVWFADGEDSKFFKALYQQDGKNTWQEGELKEIRRIGTIQNTGLYRFTASLDGLKPGSKFTWKLIRNKSELASGSARARKGKDQPYRFAVFGDIGAGSPGQKRVSYQCYQRKPDFIVMPGDIVYNCGRVSEYLQRFFPIMNSRTASPSSGAPLLSSSVAVAVLGNHDIAFTNNFQGTNLNVFPDALGYFIFWSSPLNGPVRLPNSKNSPYLFGKPEAQLDFVKATEPRYPVMANFSYDYGNSHWLILDANPYMDWNDDKLRRWVRKDLELARDQKFKFVAFHQPGFSADKAHLNEQRMRLLCDVFQEEGVDIVFAGHAHNYQRSLPLRFLPGMEGGKPIMNRYGAVPGKFEFDTTYDGKNHNSPDGVIYIVTGGGGASLYGMGMRPEDKPNFTQIFRGDCHSFTICDVDGDRLTLEQVSDQGESMDKITIVKSKKGKQKRISTPLERKHTEVKSAGESPSTAPEKLPARSP